MLILFIPEDRQDSTRSGVMSPGLASMEISAVGSTSNASRTAAIVESIEPGGMYDGVPPPK